MFDAEGKTTIQNGSFRIQEPTKIPNLDGPEPSRRAVMHQQQKLKLQILRKEQQKTMDSTSNRSINSTNRKQDYEQRRFNTLLLEQSSSGHNTRSGNKAVALLIANGNDGVGMEIDQLSIPCQRQIDDDDNDEDENEVATSSECGDEMQKLLTLSDGNTNRSLRYGTMYDSRFGRSEVKNYDLGDNEGGGGSASGNFRIHSSGHSTQLHGKQTQQPKQTCQLPNRSVATLHSASTTASHDHEGASPNCSKAHDTLSSAENCQQIVSTDSNLQSINDSRQRIALSGSDEEARLHKPRLPFYPAGNFDLVKSTSLGNLSDDSQDSKSSAFSWISRALSVLSGKTGTRVCKKTFARDNSVTSSEDSVMSESTGKHSSTSFSPKNVNLADIQSDQKLFAEESFGSFCNGSFRKRAPSNADSFVRSLHDDESSLARQKRENLMWQEQERRRRLEAFDLHVRSLCLGSNKPSFQRPIIEVSEEEADKYQTFICPRCKTRQREFFTVASAPKQFESPAGYLAMYFAIYVVASLFIFGLEEGWPALDCVYFSVITLTTTGLGDYVPSTDSAKVICSIFIYFGVACIGLLLGSLLASGLDDASSKEAKENSMNNCPNCARLQNLSRPGARGAGVASTPLGAKAGMFMSERNSSSSNSKAGTSFHLMDPFSNRSFERSLPNDIVEPTMESIDENVGFRSHNFGCCATSADKPELNSKLPLNVIQPWDREEPELNSPWYPETHRQFASSSCSLSPGSAAPGLVLGRQSHTRHQSLDVTMMGNSSLRDNLRSNKRSRMFSADIDRRAIPVIDEKAKFTNDDHSYGSEDTSIEDNEIDVTEDESSSSYFSSRSSDDGSLSPESKVKAAKYVFLTLKQAVANSVFIIAIGSVGFYFIEGISAVDSFYFTTVLLTTVGYGDIVPHTSEGKLFATVYVLVAGTVLLHNMSMISMIPLELRKRRNERAVLMQFGDEVDDATLRELATGPLIRRLQLSVARPDGLDECTREMFALAMLVRLGRVTEQDVRSTFTAFNRLDLDNDGKLNSREIIISEVQRRRRQSQLQQMQMAIDISYDETHPSNEVESCDTFTDCDETHYGSPITNTLFGRERANTDHLDRNETFAYNESQNPQLSSEHAALLFHSLRPIRSRSIDMPNRGYMSVTRTEDLMPSPKSNLCRARIMTGENQFSVLTGVNDLELGGNNGDFAPLRPLRSSSCQSRRRLNRGSSN